ncbi:hypothetical protein [Paenibacillus glycinis]|uniref:Uncharacterized protein n=1 Tax=Paenibacillus glycinis TaxID=2697035 RepID=A0ABW9XI54_9BACL|nr:hypothetical protein [Paenibacillus glycinis]NBD22300.1 hypothetical protein [Paenibacillus glycinis]
MTPTPLQFAQSIIGKHGITVQKSKSRRTALVFLAAASPARTIHIQREKFMERRERLTIVRPIEVRLLVSVGNRTTVRHTANLHAYRRGNRYERMRVSRQAVREHRHLSRHDREAQRAGDPNPVPIQLHVRQTILAPQRVMRLGSIFHNPTIMRNHPSRLAQQPQRAVPMTTSWVPAPPASPLQDTPSTAGMPHPQRLMHQHASSTYRDARSVSLHHAHPNPDEGSVGSPPRREEDVKDVAQPVAPEATAPAAPTLDMKRLTEDVYQAIERKLRIERQRKGL